MSEARVRRAVWVVLTLGILALLVRGGDSPADPSLSAGERRPLAGFTETAFRVRTPDGRALEFCALLAATAAAQAQGLMDQDDLRGYDAMVFSFTQPSTAAFYMFRTRIPLSIAWFDDGGRFVSSVDMDPCASTAASACPVYPAARPYRVAIETGRGDLGRLGLVEGATVRVGGRCA